MANKENDTQLKGNIDWQLILKIAIAILSAILGAIGGAKVQAVSTFINGII